MKKTVKKLAAVGLTLTSVMSLAACGNKDNSSSKKEATKPEKFSVMMDNTVVIEDNGGQAFRDQLEEALDLKGCIEWIQPDHSGYYDQVAQAFTSTSTMPDVVILSADKYAVYAQSGLLWDMTDAWNNSETKNSGRLISTANAVYDSLVVNGGEGTKGMYGFTATRGNGCVTFVKKAWLKDAGYDDAYIKKLGTESISWNDYYSMLKKMQETKGRAVISAPGYVSDEAPYTNYLPEFYAGANFTFYKDSTGKYVDGFSEKAMETALQRIQNGVKDGIIDKESDGQKTSGARDKFYGKKGTSVETGVFTYWAGTWKQTIIDNLASNKLDTELVTMMPIKELGKYQERLSPVWSITTACDNPEGVFTYFIDKFLDGGEVQTLWTYGAKGTHWDDKAESVTIQGNEDKPTTYKEGEFHFLPSPQTPTSLMKKNHIDPSLSLGTFKDKDPGASSVSEIAKTDEQFFADHSEVVTPLPATDEYVELIGDINTCRKSIVGKVAIGTLSPADGIAEYKKTVGDKVEKVLASYNK